MPKLSIISHFYNHPEKVTAQIEHWNSFDPEALKDIEFILVDDCSEDVPEIVKTNINLRYFRVISDIQWNQAGARNLGAFNASGDWALFFDIDQKLYPSTVLPILYTLDRLDPLSMCYFKIRELIDITNNTSLENHPNTFLVNLKEFRVRAMYDEDFAGYYGYEDLYLPKVWEQNGGNRTIFTDQVFFEDLGFGTVNADRDLSRNLALALEKMNAGCKKPQSLLRFEWEEIPVPHK